MSKCRFFFPPDHSSDKLSEHEMFLQFFWQPPFRIRDIENVNRVLQYDDGEINLTGEDRFFAEWILRYDGHIGLSRALLVGDETRIIDGPLKDYEGTIRRIDRHKRRAWVDVIVGDEVKSIQMYFEWLTVQDGNLIRLRDSRDHLQNKG